MSSPKLLIYEDLRPPTVCHEGGSPIREVKLPNKFRIGRNQMFGSTFERNRTADGTGKNSSPSP